MDYQLAEIVAYSGGDEPLHLSGVPFHFSPGERSLYLGADNTGGFVIRAGWLGLKLSHSRAGKAPTPLRLLIPMEGIALPCSK